MAWIESHQELGQHPKTIKLARMLGVAIPMVIGHLHLFWWWALNYAQDGSLGNYENCDIAGAALWEGDPNLFVDALLTCGGNKPGFLERVENGVLKIHDWDDYAGRLLDKRRADAERKKKARRHPTDIQRTSNGQSTDGAGTVPNRTVPDQNHKDDQVDNSACAHEQNFNQEQGRRVSPLPPGMTEEQFLVAYEDSKKVTLMPEEPADKPPWEEEKGSSP